MPTHTTLTPRCLFPAAPTLTARCPCGTTSPASGSSTSCHTLRTRWGPTPLPFVASLVLISPRPPPCPQIEGLTTLRLEDQEKIKGKLGGLTAGLPTGVAAAPLPDGDYLAEYAKSGRSKCRACGNAIEEGQVRLGRMERSEAEHFHGAAFECVRACSFWLNVSVCVRVCEQA